MLIFPIVNRRRVMNVELNIKNANKVKEGVKYDDAEESDIIVNNEKFSNSMFNNRQSHAQIDFIRSKSILYPRSFLVTTKLHQTTCKYDVYQLPQPPKKVNDSLDTLYSKSILDLQKEIPGKPNRGRYVSFKEIGLDDELTEDKIANLQKVIKEGNDQENFGDKLKEAGVSDVADIIDFFNTFTCTILSDSTIPEESLQDTLNALSPINTRDYRNLKKYYEMAKSNTEVYTKLSYVSKILYDKPLTLQQGKKQDQKRLIKKKEEREYKNVA